MLSNNGHDERGGYAGGTAGDQTGTEWCLIPWYRYTGGWQYMIRYPDISVGKLIAELAIEAANNNNIGYDQNERYTFWQRLPAAGYHPKNISIPCESDCSAGVAAIVKCAGYLTGRSALQNVSSDCYTGNIRQALKNAGFQVYSDSKYLTSDTYLLPGDFLLREGNHICTNVTYGSGTSGDDDEMVLEGIRSEVLSMKDGIYFAEVDADELALRVYPAEDAPLQRWDKLLRGNPVLVTGTDKSGKWAKVQFDYGPDGSEGWMWKDYLKKK